MTFVHMSLLHNMYFRLELSMWGARSKKTDVFEEILRRKVHSPTNAPLLIKKKHIKIYIKTHF